jgi:hypothetical protein
MRWTSSGVGEVDAPRLPTLVDARKTRWTLACAAEWDALVAHSRCATSFHSRAWNELIAQYDRRFEAKAWRVALPSGRSVLLPTVVRSGLLRRGIFSRAVSSQPGVYGGPIAADGPLGESGWREFVDALAGAPIGRLECFGNVLDPLPIGLGSALAARDCSTHVIEFQAADSDPWAGYRPACRRAIAKAERAGIRCERASTLNDVEAYFDVYRDTLERWGKAPARGYTRRLFELALNTPGVELWCARLSNGAIVAGGVFGFSRAHCVYWQGALRLEHAALRPMNALLHRLITVARERGCSWFDFNPSGALDGVRAFKESFGARERKFLVWRHVHPWIGTFLGRRRVR